MGGRDDRSKRSQRNDLGYFRIKFIGVEKFALIVLER